MKKYIAALMVVALILTITIQKQEASADALTAAMVSAGTFAVMQDIGITFTATGATSQGMENWMTGQVERYVNRNGGSLAALFGSLPLRATLGKLAIGYEAYNGILDFIDELKQEFNTSVLSAGNFKGVFVPSGNLDASLDVSSTGVSVLFTQPRTVHGESCFAKVEVYNDGTRKVEKTLDSGLGYLGTWYVASDGSAVWCYTNCIRSDGSTFVRSELWLAATSSLQEKLSWDTSGEITPTVLNPDKEWTGTIGGTAQPDTNIGDLLDDVFEGVADNNLQVDGEVIDSGVIGPQPTNPPVSDIPGQLEGIQEGINDIVGTQTGILEGVTDIAGTLEGIDTGIGSISEALEIPTTSEAVNLKLPDLRTLFPFCIPFDIYNIITAFNASPVAPRVQIPFNIPAVGLTYTFDLDFSSFNSVAAVLRTVEFVAYAIGLAILTSKVIRW